MSDAPLGSRCYAHYKGGIYTCHGLAKHTETNETLVVYRHVASGMLYCRPLEVWNEPARLDDGREVPRFKLIPDDHRFKV